MKILNNMLVNVDKKDIINGILTIPDGVEIIADNCLEDNEYIKVVYCPPTLKKIGNEAFQCSSIEMINLNEGLLEIGDCAFYMTDIRMIYLPDSLEYLGEDAFRDCEFLQEVRFGHHLKNIPRGCFQSTIISYIKLEDGIEKIGDCAFNNLKKLRKIDFCSTLKDIGVCAFSDSSRTLEELNFNDGLLTIGNNAFSNGCVENLYLPDSLKYIGDDIPMENLKKVSCANIEILDLFFKSQSIKYLGKDKDQNVLNACFTLNIKSLSELSNGMYGEYYFDCGTTSCIKITSYINKEDKSKLSITKDVYNNSEYDIWFNDLKKMESKIKKLNMIKIYLQSIPKNIETFLVNFGSWIDECVKSDMQETNPVDVIQTNNDEMKALTDELFNDSKQEPNVSASSLKEGISLHTNNESQDSLKQKYEIDDDGNVWMNGDLVTPAMQEVIKKSGVPIVKKKKQQGVSLVKTTSQK